MNNPEDNPTSWSPGQKLGTGLVLLGFIGWSVASMEWKLSTAGEALYFLLLPALLLALYFVDRQVWEPLPNKGLFFILLVAWLAVFQFFGNSLFGYIHSSSLFQCLYQTYNNPNPSSDDGHGSFIPFLVVGLMWWKRRELMAGPTKLWWPALGLVVLAMLLHIVSYVLQQPRPSVIAFFLGIYGLMGLIWGPGWLRRCFFPFFLFAFAMPLGGLGAAITVPLQVLVSWLVEMVAHYILGIEIIRHGTQLIDPTGTYQYVVAAACSGIRSLIAIFLIATVYAFFVFRSPWKRLLIMASAFPLAVLGNLARMLLIIIAAEIGGQSAGSYVHESTVISLVPYIPAIAGVLLLGWWMEERPMPNGQEAA